MQRARIPARASMTKYPAVLVLSPVGAPGLDGVGVTVPVGVGVGVGVGVVTFSLLVIFTLVLRVSSVTVTEFLS